MSLSVEDSAEFQLLESLCGSKEDLSDEQYLEGLQQRADRIRSLLSSLSSQETEPNSIYANLPLQSYSSKDHGRHSSQARDGEEEGSAPPPLPPRNNLNNTSSPPPVSRSHSSAGTQSPISPHPGATPLHSGEKSLSELKEERKRLINLHLQEARRYFSELQVISQELHSQNNSTDLDESHHHQSANRNNICQNSILNGSEEEVFKHCQQYSSHDNEGHPPPPRESRLPRNSPNLHIEPRLNHSSSELHYHQAVETPLRKGSESYSVSDLRMSHHRSANLEQLYREALPLHKVALLSHSGPPALQERVLSSRSHSRMSDYRTPSEANGSNRETNHGSLQADETNSVMSFISSVHSVNDNMTTRRREDIDSKIEGVNSLVSLLGCTDIEKMSRTFLAMSSSQAKCDLMRSHHVIPLLVQLLHRNEPRPSRDIRFRLSKALSNIVHSHPSDKQCKREAKVLKLLEVLRLYTDFLRDVLALQDESSKNSVCRQGCTRIAYRVLPNDTILLLDSSPDAMDQMLPDEHLIPCKNFINYSEDIFDTEHGRCKSSPLVINVEETMAILTRCSFDEGHRQPIFMLGGIPVLAELIQVEKDAHGSLSDSGHCTEVKRFAVVALTNLTFGNANIKSFLCSLEGFVPIMVAQLSSPHENLRKATAHLFRNLAWKAHKSSKQVLSDSCVVQVLMKASMDVSNKLIMDTGAEIHVKEEPTLKVILSALWNLSAHSRKNKEDICTMENAFPFLVHLLKQKFPSIVESAGGILRNVSSYIATCPNGEAYRHILREHHVLAILLSHLKSPSLTIVSNACGTLWNFSARNEVDQRSLWEMGAVPMLQSLTNSKHKTISTCALAALKNLYSYKPYEQRHMNLSPNQTGGLSLLEARKKKNLLSDMKTQKLSETCDEHEEQDSDVSSSSSASSSAESSSEDEKHLEHSSYRGSSYSTNYVNDSGRRAPMMMNNYMGASSAGASNGHSEQLLEERPTDYSLRFQEDEDDTPKRKGHEAGGGGEEVQKTVDSVKTYCTEGTPYDTPFAPISTATSMGDIAAAVADEKPQVYCTEDTPGVFSRADSLSSLDSIEHPNEERLQSIEENVEEKGQLEEAETEKRLPPSLPASKTVTFHPHETPLMFSRASSVESLNSIEQTSIREEYSSCDYSRATSGPVSPSDLPDSPCQSRPRTPSNLHPLRRPSSLGASKSEAVVPPPASGAGVAEGGKQSSSSSSQREGEKERPHFPKKEQYVVLQGDRVKAFQEEGTPANFSTRTSLSNLTFSDEDDDKRTHDSSDLFKIIGSIDKKESSRSREEKENDALEQSSEDEEDSILEAAIFSGMPKATNRDPSSQHVLGASSGGALMPKISRLPRPKSSASSSVRNGGAPTDTVDYVRRYRTEDTPGFLSHAGSNSNLSALTIDEDEDSDERDLLEACINSALPKGSRVQKFFKTPAPLGRREDGEGAPSANSGAAGGKNYVNASFSSHKSQAIVKPMPRLNRTAPTPMRRKSKPLGESNPQFNSSYQYSHSKSCNDTPQCYAPSESFSKNDSLSSVSYDDDHNTTVIDRQSLLPRPRVLGRSESSGSSQKSNLPNRESSMSNDSLILDDDAALLEDIIKSGMPKSKSEPLGFNRQGLKLSKMTSSVVKKRDKKGRDKSKSPRGSKIIPGVRIAELKLLPKKSPVSSPEIKSAPILIDSSKNEEAPRVFDLSCEEKPLKFSDPQNDLEVKDIEQEEEKSVDKPEEPSKATEESSLVINNNSLPEDCPSLESSLCSNISTIQPPSIMDSLISMSERKIDVPPLPQPSKMECRHTLSAKKGYTMPEMVRRAIGVSKCVSNEDISSLSSCQSNLDNIKAPTLLEEMDNSILSIASISSEVASGNMGSSGDSGSNPGQSLNSEQIFELIRPEAEEIHAQCMALSSNAEEEEEITKLEDIAPPTLLDELTSTSKTLVPEEIKGVDGLTYTVEDPIEGGLSTCHDITDVFDDETIEPTLTLGSYGDADEAPELPRDSRHTTPAHSGGESSHESTPQSKRKLVEQYLNYKASVPGLDDPSPILSEATNTTATNTISSGYKSAETTPNKSSRQRRKEDVDRFKTHTITKNDISPRKSDSDSSSSPKSIKQRRSEEADRFKTRVITPADLVKQLEEPRRSDDEVLKTMSDPELESSVANASPSEGSPKIRPRIRKPSEEEPPLSPKSIRGRRKPLYTSPKRSTVPPSIPPKPSNVPFRGAGSSSALSRGGIRSRTTSSASLKSTGSSVVSTPPRVSPRVPLTSTSSASSLRSTSSRTSFNASRVPVKAASGKPPPPLVRQGTFTKEEEKPVVKPISRPSSRTSLARAPSPSVAQTRTSALRERSASRGSAGQGSLSSNKSSKSSLKASSSSHSLRTVTESGIPQRAPSNPSIQRYNQTPQSSLVSETRSESGLKRSAKQKEVTSRIASLWKKVEDSKKKNKAKEAQHVRDKRIWMSKGKVIPESERALLQVHEEQRQIINEFKSSTANTSSASRDKTRSRLSIRLSKFSLKQKSTTTASTPGPGEEEADKERHSPASAIVPPFNYNPPRGEAEGLVESEPLPDLDKRLPRSRSTVRRNDSYVSSMGRVPPNNVIASKTSGTTSKKEASSSVVVTLV